MVALKATVRLRVPVSGADVLDVKSPDEALELPGGELGTVVVQQPQMVLGRHSRLPDGRLQCLLGIVGRHGRPKLPVDGADVNAQTRDAETPLALERGQAEVSEALRRWDGAARHP